MCNLQRTAYMNIRYIRNKIYSVHINVCTCILEINESSKISLLSVLSNKTDSRALSQPIFVLLNSTLPNSLEPNPFRVYWTQPYQVLLNPTLPGSLESNPAKFSWTHPRQEVVSKYFLRSRRRIRWSVLSRLNLLTAH